MTLLCRLAAAMLLLVTAATAAAHDIPASVVVQAFVRPQGSTLRVLVRVPMSAMRDLEFPLKDGGLVQAARLWLANDIAMYEGDTRLPVGQVVAARASLPSDRSFVTFEGALAHVTESPAKPVAAVAPNTGFLDALIEYPITSDRATFSIDPSLARLGVAVVTALRYQPPAGAERAFELTGNPGLVRLDPRWHQAAWRFTTLGVAHILDGTDHLLFLACLVIPFRRFRPLVVIVTAFTLAHSLTLIAAASGLVPDALWFSPLIETLIATSILFMALENIVGSSSLQRRWMMAFGFGLVHGFGFSFALRDTLQFAGSHLLSALLAFNLGVEIGQLLVLAVLIPALHLLFKYVLEPRVGTIILSALVAHTAWHWTAERWEQLRLFRLPSPIPDSPLAVVRWLLVVVTVAALAWIARIARRRRGANGAVDYPPSHAAPRQNRS